MPISPLIIACPYCSSMYVQFDRFGSATGTVSAIVILAGIFCAPFMLHWVGWKIGPRPEKRKARAAWVYVGILLLWIWFLLRLDEFRPDYNRSDAIVAFSDVMLYYLFLPFTVLWNGAVNPIMFSASPFVSVPIGLMWLVSPPVLYGKIANRFDRKIERIRSPRPQGG